MTFMKYFERKDAMKELGKGNFASAKENYEDKVGTIVDTMCAMYDKGNTQLRDHIDNTVDQIKDAKYDRIVATIGTGVALGTTALSVIGDLPADALMTIASSTMAVICMIGQVKANNRAKKAETELRDVFSETVNEDEPLPGIVYLKHSAEKHGMPFYYGISNETRKVCLSDACDQFVKHADELVR